MLPSVYNKILIFRIYQFTSDLSNRDSSIIDQRKFTITWYIWWIVFLRCNLCSSANISAYRQSIAGYLDIGVLLVTDVLVLSFLTCMISLQVAITSNNFFFIFLFVIFLSRICSSSLIIKKIFSVAYWRLQFLFKMFFCIFMYFFIFINSNIKNISISLDNRILNLQILRKKFKQWYL